MQLKRKMKENVWMREISHKYMLELLRRWVQLVTQYPMTKVGVPFCSLGCGEIQRSTPRSQPFSKDLHRHDQTKRKSDDTSLCPKRLRWSYLSSPRHLHICIYKST